MNGRTYTENEDARLTKVLGMQGYRVTAWEGGGAFARVYRAERKKDGRIFACKVVNVEKPDGERAGAILRREAEILEGLNHPLFPRYEDFFRKEGYAVLMMEYAAGTDLDKITAAGPLEQRAAVEVTAQLAEGLRYLHERPGTILYRDLKPQNIRITPKGRARLLDLGCACRTAEAAASRAGSRGYAAPEQFGESGPEAQACGPYSDVYALGRLFHLLLTGEDPCLPPYHKQPIRAYDPNLSPLLERLAAQCADPDPRKRPPDMRSVLRQLEDFRRRSPAGRFLAEQTARLRLLFRGGSLESAYRCEKNICILPNLQNASGTDVVI